MVKIKKDPEKVPNFVKTKSLFRTIKTSLKSIIRNPKYQRILNDLVIECNDIVIDTYQFIRLYILYLYKSNKVIPNLDTNFIADCITTIGIKDSRGKQSQNKDLLNELKAFYDNEYQSIFNHQKHNLHGLSYVFPYICQTIETCYNNNLKEHFMTRLFRYINIFAG